MAIFDKNNSEIEAQIKILATNLEILNQKLNQNPDAGISPGEKAIQDRIAENTKELTYVKNVLKSTQVDGASIFKNEKEGLTSQVTKLAKVTNSLGKFDKPWLGKLIDQIERLNLNAQNLGEQIEKYQKKQTEYLDSQKAAIIKEIYGKLFNSLKKDNLVMMAFTSLLSSVVALVVLLGLLYFIK